ncbi:DNA-binding domain-containing protein [Salipiger mucosus]|uniref:Putative DNA-binding domain-containing protein n=1 Tax=Salipiger mucosus DSM 16094 TaxID=1123237 RepID=S9Q4M3_9RHOB|nr:DUF2063 domain-containing protein [Salipiger mucosus]EPX76296.1 hypothetical protein Salmuc_01282 [Salipiger mucosus DSM 16094]
MSQQDFRDALLDPARPVPKGLTTGTGAPAGRRYDVYRNNVAHSLREALEVGFPTVRALVGERNFTVIADAYLRAEPPSSPLMMHYGSGLPAFLEAFKPLEKLGYLPDCARLDLAMRQSYHAADAAPIDPAALSRHAPERLAALRLHLAPALRLVPSKWPTFSIRNHALDRDSPKPPARAETALILRPEFDSIPHIAPPGGAAFVAALAKGHPLGKATEAAGPTFDPGPTLALLLRHGAITGLEET